ncbi:hypothetical protein E2562_013186 [Oryza meyeriana var. granulata]|uniref:Phosphoglycerate kinase n=1 Tax=Oryza meyeriana var. granulata TaxID=110450 RepID=A0A6G1DKH3_9ORYZ|nr:hypothetical protein E2562_013186 [Oryza meyeriana var. granulata]
MAATPWLLHRRTGYACVDDLAAADLEKKRVLVHANLNVPLDDSQNITDDTRVRAAIPTIKHLISNGAKVILSSHLDIVDIIHYGDTKYLSCQFDE